MDIKKTITPFLLVLVSLISATLLYSCKAGNVPEVGPDSPIEISISGGGIYGGINPTTSDRTVIHGDGRIVASHDSLYQEPITTELSATRTEVEQLAREIASLGFFDMDTLYDCNPKNKKCEQMKTSYPPFVPITVEVTIDLHKNSVKVTVFDRKVIGYPAKLDEIILKIRRLIGRHTPK